MLRIIGGTGSPNPPWFSYWVICMPVSGKLALYHQGRSPKTLKGWRGWVAVVPQKAELFRGLSARISYWNGRKSIGWWFVVGPTRNSSGSWQILPVKRRTTWWTSGSLWSKFLRWPTPAVDHYACSFEGSFLNFGWFNLHLVIWRARLLKSIKEELGDYKFDPWCLQQTNGLRVSDQILVLNKGHQVGLEIMISSCL